MHPASRSRAQGGFTLVEILVAAAVTVILVGILLKITTLTSATVSVATQRLSSFAAARTAFDVMTRNLSQATLNTYLDYYGNTSGGTTATLRRTQSITGSFTPVAFGRASDLQFVIQQNVQNSGNANSIGVGNRGQEVYFQAPRAYSIDPNLQSVQGLLNACGYYVRFDNGGKFAPSAFNSAATAKYRYRLMQGMEPTDDLQIYSATALSDATGTAGQTSDSASTWLGNIKNGVINPSEYITPLADNIIALIVWPRLSASDQAANPTVTLTSNYTYDSQSGTAPILNTSGTSNGVYTQGLTADQLPPDVQVTMIALDEFSAVRAQGTSTTAPAAIETALKNRFVDPTQYATDMLAVAANLSGAPNHFNFEIFNSTVTMRESKWTTTETTN